MVLGWVAGMVAGAWVLVSPPQSYDALDLTLTTVWGAFLLGGSLLVAGAHLLRKYKVEIPGLVDRKSTRLNSSHPLSSRMPSSA